MTDIPDPQFGAPANAPDISTDQYAVQVRLLRGQNGLRLLVPTTAQIDVKWRDLKDSNAVAWASLTDEERTALSSQQAEAEKMDRSLFAQLEEERGSEIQTYTFIFRPPTIDEVQKAERAAGMGVERSEIEYRKALATLTFLSSDYPGYKSMGALPPDVALHVFREVWRRSTLAGDVKDFLLPQAANSAAASASPET